MKNCVRRHSCGWLCVFICLVLSAGCNPNTRERVRDKQKEKQKQKERDMPKEVDRTDESLARGTRILGQLNQSDFREGRVFEAHTDGVRFTCDDGRHEARKDHLCRATRLRVWRFDQREVSEPSPGEMAVCHWEAFRWMPCQVESVNRDKVVARDRNNNLRGLSIKELFRLDTGAQEDIRVAFERDTNARSFDREFAAAGEPPHRIEKLTVGQHVLAYRGGSNWTGGTIVPARKEPAENAGKHANFEVEWDDCNSNNCIGGAVKYVQFPDNGYAAKPGGFILVRPERNRQWHAGKAISVGTTVLWHDRTGVRWKSDPKNVIPLVR